MPSPPEAKRKCALNERIVLLKEGNICETTPMKCNRHYQAAQFFLLCSLILGAGCETVEKAVSSKLPTVKADDVRLKTASFTALDLVVDLDIMNPNMFGLSMSSFDYDLQVSDTSLISGNKTDAVRLEGGQNSVVSVPMSVSFQDLASTIPNILEQDTFDYALKGNLTFNIPIVGMVKVPVSKAGTLPVIRPPKIKDIGISKRGINLTGADLDLNVSIENSNAFDLLLKDFQYAFGGNEQTWASGRTGQSVDLSSKGSGELSIPVHLNFLSLGKTVFQLLSGAEAFNAQLSGNMILDSSLKYLPETSIPIDFQKNLSLK